MQRRDFLNHVLNFAALSASSTALPRWAAAQTVQTRALSGVAQNPFQLGVASGFPTENSVVLWTRLLIAPDPLAMHVMQMPVLQMPQHNAMPYGQFTVRFEVASDAAFKTIEQSGSVEALAMLGYSVHVELQGLTAGRDYWYRFMLGDAVSAVGRTHTLPALNKTHDTPAAFKMGIASCQHWEHGYFSAYQGLLAQNPDAVLFLGDYIYEGRSAPNRVRAHLANECLTLADYRARYALYKSDPDLQALHAACPWWLVWDDHEVQNDYAYDRGQDASQTGAMFLQRRAAAYQAYYENMPLPLSMLRAGLQGLFKGDETRIYGTHACGNLINLHLLDDRQYRSHQACARPGRGGSTTVNTVECPELLAPARTLLGTTQETWLAHNLQQSKARWNLIGQQTLLAQNDSQSPLNRHLGKRVWTDGWDGYPAARTRFVNALSRAQNVLVLGGDVHAHYVSDVKADYDRPDSKTVAAEVCGTSITSPSWAQERTEKVAQQNPHIHYARSDQRGYCFLTIRPQKIEVQLRAVADVQAPSARLSTLAEFVLHHGNPQIEQV